MPLGVYPPSVGETGTTALANTDPLFIDWAAGASVTRGLINITDPSATYDGSSYATAGTESNVIGAANNAIVSLGDRGEAILTFATPITDGSGFDFAVFENGFSNTFLELAFVEVSSDGINYVRFPNHSQTQTDTQVGGFGAVDATYINNLAGKYRATYGTPFDINDIADNPLLNKSRITHVKIIDVVGIIDPAFASYDSYGNMINDPFPTPFHTGGFDLDAVGVINQASLSVTDNTFSELKLYPNPASDFFTVKSTNHVMDISIYDITGKLIEQLVKTTGKDINISNLKQGVYIVKVTAQNKNGLFRLIKQ
ncbi:T9SS type A sorting domain-containing protein [Bizionia myxarmorum]|uniref:T9SS type A sorting domain-containing protein n=2 Tax=Bizionia myxarmorum TaxID=291186 RepID=A0A5D0R744_9FLAO|nr:T9SS type A sorting domain-containing protein [Bizionia myxarmorum]